MVKNGFLLDKSRSRSTIKLTVIGKKPSDEPMPLHDILREIRESEGDDHPKLRIIRLHFLEGWSHGRISKTEGIPLHSVKRCLRKVRWVGVHVALKRGWHKRGARNRNYGLDKVDEVDLRARIEAGWESARATQQWFRVRRGEDGPSISIAALYAYRKRLFPDLSMKKPKESNKVRRSPKNCISLLRKAVFSPPAENGTHHKWPPKELREMVRRSLGAEQMSDDFLRLGAREVTGPVELVEMLDVEGQWFKVLGVHAGLPAASGDTTFALLLERNTRFPRGGYYLRSGFLISVAKGRLRNLSPALLRDKLQDRFMKVYGSYRKWNSCADEGDRDRRKVVEGKLSEFWIIHAGSVDPQWWFEGIGRWSATEATAFQQRLKFIAANVDAVQSIAGMLLKTENHRPSTKST